MGRSVSAVCLIVNVSLLALLAGAPGAAQNPDQQARAAYAAGEKAFAGQRYAEAAEAYQKAASLRPQIAELHAKLGVARLFNRECGAAVKAFQEALRRKPELETAKTLRALCLSELGRYREAAPGLEKGFESPPNYEGMKRALGLALQRTYLALGRDAGAARITAELHSLYPQDPEVLYHASRAYSDLSLLSSRALSEVAPDSVWAHQALGEAYESRQFFELAANEYRQALAKDPQRPGLHFRLGKALLGQAGDPGAADEALAYFQKELEINPSHTGAAYELGEIYRRKTQFDKALKYFERALQNRPEFEETHIAMGQTLFEMKDLQRARKHLEKAVELNAENETSRYVLARVYRELGDREAQREQLRHYRRLREQEKQRARSLLSGGAPDADPVAARPANPNPSQ